MTHPVPADLARFAEALAERAATETLPRFRDAADAQNKTPDRGYDPVTEADRQAERALRAAVADRFPDHAFLGEEDGASGGASPWRWVVDPVDGTRSFVCGVPVWSTLIALEYEGVPVHGVIDQPVLGQRWTGGMDNPALLNGDPARTSGCERLEDARLMITDIRTAPEGYLSESQAGRLAALWRRCRLLRQGLDSFAFGLVASGRMDLVVEAGLHWHDIAAVIPVVEAAGGTVTDWQGERPREGWDGTCIAASSLALAEAARAVMTA
ncbi:inositol monophosphatase family protein [Parvularcula oceani]|uniref:inositol monophosphatase family protein n=1 Tax=Parvularcula oceani TaxID=1247963 RepID=UPI0004E1E54F|nr:inositol monophosphatase family protein [Parvularcula oceani]